MRTVIVLAVLLYSGCLTPHCGPAYDELTWRDEGLYAAITGAEPAAFVTWDPGAGALPWDRPSTWTGERLWTVGMEVPRPNEESRGIFVIQDPHVMSMVVERDGVLVGMVEGNVSDGTVRAVFDAAVAGLTRDGFDPNASWDAFRASRRPSATFVAVPLDEEATSWEERQHWHHQVSLTGWLDLDALAARVQLPAPTVGGIGYAHASAGGWTFTSSLPAWTVDGSRDGSQGVLRVDSADQATLRLHPGRETAEGLHDEADAFLAFVGLEAKLDGASASGSSC